MSRKFGLLLSLILLTQLDGHPIWVESTAIVIVKQTHTGLKEYQCKAPSNTIISVGTRGLCVLETEDVVRKKIEDAK